MKMAPATSTRVATLAALIAEHTAIVEKHLKDTGLNQLSFEADRPQLPHLPAHVEYSRAIALQSTAELYELLREPSELIREKLHTGLPIAMDLITRYRVAEKVPPHPADVSYAHLASQLNIPEDRVRRVLRVAVAHRVFQEPRPGYIAHTAMSRALVDAPELLDWWSVVRENHVPAMLRAVDCLPDEDSCPFAVAHGTDKSFYEVVNGDPERARSFAGAMKLCLASRGGATGHLVNNYPWSRHRLVVDVGGSRGATARAVVERHPDVRVVVQDLEGVIRGAETEAHPNIEFMVHDFFEPQPVVGADVYMIRWVLHDWSDEDCRRILRALVGALRGGSRVLILEALTPAFESLTNSAQRGVCAMDMSMFLAFNSKERTGKEWRDIITSADERFVIDSITTPKGSSLSLIDIAWRP